VDPTPGVPDTPRCTQPRIVFDGDNLTRSGDIARNPGPERDVLLRIGELAITPHAIAPSIARQIGARPEALVLYALRKIVRVGGPLLLLMIVAFSIALARACPA
jgi:hypothetical protein